MTGFMKKTLLTCGLLVSSAVFAYDANVAQTQSDLHRLGYDAGPFDGVLGQATTDAILELQNDYQLTPTGKVNAETKAQITQLQILQFKASLAAKQKRDAR